MDIKKIFNREINYNIDFIEIESDADHKFMEECCNAKDFSDFITEGYIDDEYLIIHREGQNIGICALKIENRMGIRTARPNIYITHRKSLSSFLAINSVAYHLFRHENIDRLELRIYSNNKQMLSIANCGVYIYEGRMKYCKRTGDTFVDLYFYSILKKEFDALLESD